MVICLERDADLHMAQLMPLPLTVSCFSKIQIGFTFPVYRLTWVVPEKGPLNGCVCVACRLTAKNQDQLRNPTLGNRVIRATFAFVNTHKQRILLSVCEVVWAAPASMHGSLHVPYTG